MEYCFGGEPIWIRRAACQVQTPLLQAHLEPNLHINCKLMCLHTTRINPWKKLLDPGHTTCRGVGGFMSGGTEPNSDITHVWRLRRSRTVGGAMASALFNPPAFSLFALEVWSQQAEGPGGGLRDFSWAEPQTCQGWQNKHVCSPLLSCNQPLLSL